MIRNACKTILLVSLAIFLLTTTRAAEYNKDGSITGKSGTFKFSLRGDPIFTSKNGSKLLFHLSASHRPEIPYFGWGITKNRVIKRDPEKQKTTITAEIPKMGITPKTPVKYSFCLLRDNRTVRFECQFNCDQPIKKVYQASIRLHIHKYFDDIRRTVSINGKQVNMAFGDGTKKGKQFYRGPATSVKYRSVDDAIIMNMKTIECGGMFVGRAVQFNALFGQFIWGFDNKNRIIIDFDIDEKPVSLEKKYLVESIDFGPNDFQVPDYSASKNLVQNPSFEDGFYFWDYHKMGWICSPLEEEPYSIDEDVSKFGRRSLRIKTRAKDSPAPPCTFAIPVIQNSDYTLSFWAKTDKPKIGHIQIGGHTQVYNPTDPKSTSLPVTKFKLTKDWKRYSCTFKAPNKLLYVYFANYRNPEQSTVWLDGVQLEKGSQMTDLSLPPASVVLVTDTRDNLSQPGEKANARFHIQSIQPETGRLSYVFRDFFGRIVNEGELPFKTPGQSNALEIPLPECDTLPSGLYVAEVNLKLDGNKAYHFKTFHRLVRMTYRNGKDKNRDLFCISAIGPDGRVPNWKRLLDFIKKIGFGSLLSFDPTPNQNKLLENYGFMIYHSIFHAGHSVLNKKYNVSRPKSPEKGLLGIRDDEFPLIEEEAYRKAKNNPHINAWKMINEPHHSQDEIKRSIELIKWVRKGILRANPKAKIISTDMANFDQGIPYLKNFLRYGGGKYCDIIGIHGYRHNPDTLDEDLVRLITLVDKYKKGAYIWITEGGYYQNYNIPDLDFDASEYGGDFYRGGDFSYDLGYGEKACLANAMHYRLQSLKHIDRVKVDVDWSSGGRQTLGIDMTPQALCFAVNTLANILGNADFVSDIEMGENIRCYLFKDDQERPIAVFWNFKENILRSTAPLPTLPLKHMRSKYDVINCMNAKEKLSKNELTISGYPIFLRGEPGKVTEFKDDLSKIIPKNTKLNMIDFFFKINEASNLEAVFKNRLAKKIEGYLKYYVNNQEVLSKSLQLDSYQEFKYSTPLPKAPVENHLQKVVAKMQFIPASGNLCERSGTIQYFTAKMAGAGFKIDGAENKWAPFPAIPLKTVLDWKPPKTLRTQYQEIPKHQGKDDLSANVRWAWDKDNLYLRVDIKDNVLSTPPDAKSSSWQYDSIQIYFDSFANAWMNNANGFHNDDQTYDIRLNQDNTVTVSRGIAPDWQIGFSHPGIIKNIPTFFHRDNDGYYLEIAFSRDIIKPIIPEPGLPLGVSVLINDNDNDFRKRSLYLNKGGEPFKNPKLYPIMILSK